VQMNVDGKHYRTIWLKENELINGTSPTGL
jgi:hypothetical protein